MIVWGYWMGSESGDENGGSSLGVGWECGGHASANGMVRFDFIAMIHLGYY